MSRLSPKPFVPAEIPPPDPAVHYTYGFNLSGTGQHEVLQVVGTEDGPNATYVIMRGLSQAKVRAIVMILNAPEEA